jgi:hypothetical protein
MTCEWIDARKERPGFMEIAFLALKSGEVYFGVYFPSSDRWIGPDGEDIDTEVIYWMRLPEHPGIRKREEIIEFLDNLP